MADPSHANLIASVDSPARRRAGLFTVVILPVRRAIVRTEDAGSRCWDSIRVPAISEEIYV